MGGVLDGRAAEGSRSGRFDHPRVGTGDGNRRRPREQTRVVFHEVDDALRALIGRHLGEETGVEVAFDAPNSDWAARQSAPTINVFLYDIREDTSRRDAVPQDVRNDDGRVIARRPPPRRFRVSYLLTAWTQRPEDEHRLLAQVLSALLAYGQLPSDVLSGSLAELGVTIPIEVAQPPSQDRSLSDIWSALGGELKPSIDLQLIAPVDPGRSFPIGPPVVEEPRIRVGNIGADAPAEVYRASRKDAPMRAARSDGDHPGSENVQAGTDDDPGRTLSIRIRESSIVDDVDRARE